MVAVRMPRKGNYQGVVVQVTLTDDFDIYLNMYPQAPVVPMVAVRIPVPCMSNYQGVFAQVTK
jgi:hypothetical protein